MALALERLLAKQERAQISTRTGSTPQKALPHHGARDGHHTLRSVVYERGRNQKCEEHECADREIGHATEPCANQAAGPDTRSRRPVSFGTSLSPPASLIHNHHPDSAACRAARTDRYTTDLSMRSATRAPWLASKPETLPLVDHCGANIAVFSPSL
jgi:hypothetical protein